MNQFFSISKLHLESLYVKTACVLSGLCYIALDTLQSLFCIAHYEMGRVVLWESCVLQVLWKCHTFQIGVVGVRHKGKNPSLKLHAAVKHLG